MIVGSFEIKPREAHFQLLADVAKRNKRRAHHRTDYLPASLKRDTGQSPDPAEARLQVRKMRKGKQASEHGNRDRSAYLERAKDVFSERSVRGMPSRFGNSNPDGRATENRETTERGGRKSQSTQFFLSGYKISEELWEISEEHSSLAPRSSLGMGEIRQLSVIHI
jgi:hypothetical protein